MKKIDPVIMLLLISALVSTALGAGCGKRAAKQESPAYSAAQIERGAELVGEWKCNYCHTPEVRGNGRPVPDPERLLSGHPSDQGVPDMHDMIMGSAEYMEFLDNLEASVWASDDKLVFAANITPDNETGIGTWSEEAFIQTMRSGTHMGIGRRILYPMPWQELSELDDADLIAIYAYLRTVKPVHNSVPPPIVLFR